MLIVDDSRTMRSYLAAVAHDLRFDTEFAANGEEALDRLFHADHFDVSLVDWDMPKMDGMEFINKVRARPEFDLMKLVMVTSQSTMDSVCKALTQGADEYLIKPITPEMLADKLRLLGLAE